MFATPGMLHAGQSLNLFKNWAEDDKNMVRFAEIPMVGVERVWNSMKNEPTYPFFNLISDAIFDKYVWFTMFEITSRCVSFTRKTVMVSDTMVTMNPRVQYTCWLLVLYFFLG